MNPEEWAAIKPNLLNPTPRLAINVRYQPPTGQTGAALGLCEMPHHVGYEPLGEKARNTWNLTKGRLQSTNSLYTCLSLTSIPLSLDPQIRSDQSTTPKRSPSPISSLQVRTAQDDMLPSASILPSDALVQPHRKLGGSCLKDLIFMWF